MNKSERLRVLNTLAERIASGTTADAGGIMRVPMSDFTCPQLLTEEQEAFFRNTPLCMGLSSELPEPDTYWSDNATGIPILMVRDAGGAFRAYANVCRHRGSKVVLEGRGSATRFTCPFHAWTYGVDGRLLKVYQDSQFGDVSNRNLSLIALPAAEFHGTLWIRPTPGDPIHEGECLSGLEDDLAHWNLSEHPVAGTQIIDARMNWKLVVDSYGEIYHLNILHTKTAAKEALGNLQRIDAFDNHLRMVVANQKFNVMRLFMPNMASWPYRQITSTTYFLYPNVIMMVDTFGVDMLRIFPLDDSPVKSRTIHTWYIHPNVEKHFKTNGLSYEDRMRTYRAAVADEDYAMGEDVQLNADMGIQSEILLGRNEGALQHFHNVRRSAMGRELLPVEDP